MNTDFARPIQDLTRAGAVADPFFFQSPNCLARKLILPFKTKNMSLHFDIPYIRNVRCIAMIVIEDMANTKMCEHM